MSNWSLGDEYVGSGEPQQFLGRFASGEIPPALLHQFDDSEDNDVNLVGFTITVNITATAGVTATLGAGTPTLSDGPTGVGQYAWHSDDMSQPGSYRLQMWASNGTNKYASDVFTYIVYDGPGTAP